MKFVLALKQEMTQKFQEDGTVVPVTKLLVQPCVVTQLKNKDRDGYISVQVATGQKRNLPKPLKGHFKDLGSFRFVKEFRLKDDADIAQAESLKTGDKITAETFTAGDIIQVTGISKGRGFQGVVKRHGFHGSLATHGHKDQLRMPGSIGSTGPAHVFKGTKMGGQMGNVQVTVKNLEVIEVDSEAGEVFIKGAVPGARGGLIIVSGAGELIIAEETVEETKVEEKTEEIKPEATEATEATEEKKEEVKEESKTEEIKPEEVKEEPKEEKVEEKK